MPASLAQREEHDRKIALAIELYQARLTYAEIARQVGYADAASAKNALSRAIAQATYERTYNVDLLVTEELMMLNRLQRAAWPQALKGDAKAQDTILKIHDRRVKMLRLVENPGVTVNLTVMDAQRRITELKAKLGEDGDYAWDGAGVGARH